MSVLIAVGFIALILGYILIYYRWRKLKPYNQSPLKIQTFDGLNSPFHPSVLYFADGWNGWKYWMVETPFSPKCRPYVDRNECPSIHVSNDGKNWAEPKGLNNPLVNFGVEGEKNLDYYSDPHLVMRDGKMECWYRLTERHGDVYNRDKVSLRRIVSTDGVNWSDEEIISRLWENADGKGLGKMVVSQALIYNPEEGYTMWYVNSEDHNGERQIVFSRSNDGVNWIDAKLCEMHGFYINPWHIDVQQDFDGSLLMTVYDNFDLTLWQSSNGKDWKFVFRMLSPSHVVGSFYRNGLYRSCIVKDDMNYKLYFSAYDLYKTYIGLAEIKIIDKKIVVISENPNHSLREFILYIINDEYNHIKFIIKHCCNKFIIRRQS